MNKIRKFLSVLLVMAVVFANTSGFVYADLDGDIVRDLYYVGDRLSDLNVEFDIIPFDFYDDEESENKELDDDFRTLESEEIDSVDISRNEGIELEDSGNSGSKGGGSPNALSDENVHADDIAPIIRLEVPVEIPFMIDRFGSAGRGQVFSDDFLIKNLSDVDVYVDVLSLEYTMQDVEDNSILGNVAISFVTEHEPDSEKESRFILSASNPYEEYTEGASLMFSLLGSLDEFIGLPSREKVGVKLVYKFGALSDINEEEFEEEGLEEEEEFEEEEELEEEAELEEEPDVEIDEQESEEVDETDDSEETDENSDLELSIDEEADIISEEIDSMFALFFSEEYSNESESESSVDSEDAVESDISEEADDAATESGVGEANNTVTEPDTGEADNAATEPDTSTNEADNTAAVTESGLDDTDEAGDTVTDTDEGGGESDSSGSDGDGDESGATSDQNPSSGDCDSTFESDAHNNL